MKIIKIAVLIFAIAGVAAGCTAGPISSVPALKDISGADWVNIVEGEKVYFSKVSVSDIAVLGNNIYLATNEGVYTYDESNALVLLAGNAGLTEPSGEFGGAFRSVVSLAVDSERGVVYSIKLEEEDTYGRVVGLIYRFAGDKWEIFSNKLTTAINFQDGNLYAVQKDGYYDDSQKLNVYYPSGESKEFLLDYEYGPGSCFSVVAQPSSDKVFLSCIDGLYSFNTTSSTIKMIESYTLECDPPCNFPRLYDLTRGFNEYTLIGLRGDEVTYDVYGVIIQTVEDSGTGEADLQALDGDYYGPIYNDAVKGLYIYNFEDFVIYNYSGGSWNEIKNAKEWMDYTYSYNKVSYLCHNSEDGKIYGLGASSMVKIDGDKVENIDGGFENLSEICKSVFSDDLSSIDTETEFGLIMDYVDLSDVGLEFAVTHKIGNIIFRENGGAWTKINPDVPDFAATAVAVDKANMNVYVSAETSGVFKLPLF